MCSYLLIFILTNSSRMSRHYDRIVAFEPLHSTANLLRRNLKLNHIDNVEVIEKALSDRNGPATFYLYEGNEMNSLLPTHMSFDRDNEESHGNTIVETVRLDDYNFSPDLVKIDVEGAELDVLKGMKETIRRTRPILLVEVHVKALEEQIESFLPDYSWKKHYRDLAGGRTQTHLVGH